MGRKIIRKLICFDVDSTLCTSGFPRKEPRPINKMIKIVQKLHDLGHYIIIYTARQEKYYPETKAWLVKHKVPFVAIAMRHKPQASCYIDDKAYNPKDLTNI